MRCCDASCQPENLQTEEVRCEHVRILRKSFISKKKSKRGKEQYRRSMRASKAEQTPRPRLLASLHDSLELIIITLEDQAKAAYLLRLQSPSELGDSCNSLAIAWSFRDSPDSKQHPDHIDNSRFRVLDCVVDRESSISKLTCDGNGTCECSKPYCCYKFLADD